MIEYKQGHRPACLMEVNGRFWGRCSWPSMRAWTFRTSAASWRSDRRQLPGSYTVGLEPLGLGISITC